MVYIESDNKIICIKPEGKPAYYTMKISTANQKVIRGFGKSRDYPAIISFVGIYLGRGNVCILFSGQTRRQAALDTFPTLPSFGQ